MKVIWEASDIIAGRLVGSPDRNEQWRIGYMANGDDDKWALVSQSDGLIQPPTTRERLADQLNKCGDMPVELFSR